DVAGLAQLSANVESMFAGGDELVRACRFRCIGDDKWEIVKWLKAVVRKKLRAAAC
ncbi:hypothetical protein GOP47_0027363, partial [Adiantum capillus-veneris]